MDWADTFVMAYVTDYFELNADQKNIARTEFNTAFTDSKKQDFPVYARIMTEIADATEKDQLNGESLEPKMKEVERTIQRSMERFEPMAQKVIESQVASHFQMFDQEFQKKYEKDLAKLKSEKDPTSKYFEKVEKWVSETTEYLTDAQKVEIRESLKKNPSPVMLQIESRKAVYEKFKVARGNEKTRRDFIHQFLFDWPGLQTPTYQKARLEHQQRVREIIIKTAESLSPEQKKNLIKKLRIRAAELNRIANKS